MGQLFFHEESIYQNFKTLACTVRKIWHASDVILIFSKGHNSRKGDNSDKKKNNVCQLFFHEESIYSSLHNANISENEAKPVSDSVD